MIYNHLNPVEFLLYLELLFALIIIIQSVIIPLPFTFITSIFNVISYKSDAIILYLNIPFTVIGIISVKVLIVENTLNLTSLDKSFFYAGGLFILAINQLIHRKSVYQLAIKENNFLLKYTTWKFFKLINWLYPLIFLSIMFVNFDFKNFISSGLFFIINWFYHVKFIGGLLPILSALMLLGTTGYAIFFSFNFCKIKKEFEIDFYNDALRR